MAEDKVICERIRRFLQVKSETDSSYIEPGILPGVFEKSRLKGLDLLLCENLRQIDLFRLIAIKSSIYEIYHIHSSMIFAVSKNDELLWLDDHRSDSDYSAFLNMENVFGTLSQDASMYTEVIVKSKLNYLGVSKILNTVDDIPVESSLASRRTRSQTKKHLKNLKALVKPPNLIFNTDDFHLQFTIWTKVYGRVITVDCIWENHKFTYGGITHARAVGDYVVYR